MAPTGHNRPVKMPAPSRTDPGSQPGAHPRDADFLRLLGHALGVAAEPQELVRQACKLTGEYLGASRCYFAEVEDAYVTVRDDWHTPDKNSIGGSYARSDFLPPALWDDLAENGLAVADVQSNEFTKSSAQNFQAISVQSFAAAPFIRGGRWVAALAATDSQPRAWRPDEIDLLRTVAARAWPLVERAREEIERARAEEALRVSEERLRLSCRAAGVGPWEWSVHSNEVYWSPEYREIYGLDPHAPPSFEQGMSLVHEEDRIAIQEAILDAVNTGKEYRSEHRIHHPTKGLRWIEAVGKMVNETSDKSPKMLGIVRDVTERHDAEAKVRESESQLRALVDTIPQLAWIADPDGSIFWYNRGWYAYTGTTLEQMKGWGWQSVHDPTILPDVLKRWKQSIETGLPFEMLFPLRNARGEFRWFLTRVNPLHNSRGEVVRWFGTNTDIHQVKREKDVGQDGGVHESEEE